MVVRRSAVSPAKSCGPIVIVLDALDECGDARSRKELLFALAEESIKLPFAIRFVMTSRREVDIDDALGGRENVHEQELTVTTTDRKDIAAFFQHYLALLGQKKRLGLPQGWPDQKIIRDLTERSTGLFIWAATACRFIREGKRFARRRLDTILKGSSSIITAPEKHLDEIYLTVLKHSISSEYSDEEKEAVYYMLKHTLGSIVVLLLPLSSFSLSRLLHLPREDVNQTFEDLHL